MPHTVDQRPFLGEFEHLAMYGIQQKCLYVHNCIACRSRFAGNAWVIEGQSTQGTRHEQATHADHVYVYGGWGVDESQQQVYLSDMWVALA